MEELSKKLADHDQASKVQQQKLKVGQWGDGPSCQPQSENRGGKGLCEPLGCSGYGGRGGGGPGMAALHLPVAQEPLYVPS